MSAGHSTELEAVLHAECAEARALASEAALLSQQLADSMVALEDLRIQGASRDQEVLKELPSVRCAFRKRGREGYCNAMRLAFSLHTLENEFLSAKRQVHESTAATKAMPQPSAAASLFVPRMCKAS